jgi:hypothetical protein
MAEQFDAGSVFVQFKAQAEGVVAASKKAGDSVKQFGDKAAGAAKRVDAASAKVASSFAKINKESASLAGRAASMGQRLIGVQLAMQTIVGTTGEMSRELQTAAQAFSAFAAIVSVFPTPLGLVVGLVAALVIGLKGLLGPSDEATKALEKQKKAADELAKSLDALNKVYASRQVGAFAKSLEESGIVEREIAKLEEDRARTLEELGAILKNALDIRLKLRGELENTEGFTQKDLDQQLKIIDRLKGQAKEQTRIINLKKQAIAEADAEFAKAKAQRAEEKSAREKAALDADMERKKAAAEAEANAKRLFQLSVEQLRQKIENDKLAAEEEERLIMEATEAAIAGEDARYQKRLADLAALEDAEKAYVDQIQIYEDTAREEARIKREAELQGLSKQFRDRFADPFAYSISSAFQEGLTQGMTAFEAVANFGEKVFADMVGGFAKDLQTTIGDVISDLAGAAGEELGGVVQGIVGIAGFFLSQRGSRSGSQRFADATGVTSTQAVRGVVAGPTNIAISAVGDNLSRSMLPVLEKMDEIIGILRSFSFGGGGAGSAPYAGSVPTS